VTSPHPFQGWFVILRLEIATINLPTKVEIYERRYKMSKMGWFWVVGATQGHCRYHRLVERNAFLLAFHTNYVSILHSF